MGKIGFIRCDMNTAAGRDLAGYAMDHILRGEPMPITEAEPTAAQLAAAARDREAGDDLMAEYAAKWGRWFGGEFLLPAFFVNGLPDYGVDD